MPGARFLPPSLSEIAACAARRARAVDPARDARLVATLCDSATLRPALAAFGELETRGGVLTLLRDGAPPLHIFETSRRFLCGRAAGEGLARGLAELLRLSEGEACGRVFETLGAGLLTAYWESVDSWRRATGARHE